MKEETTNVNMLYRYRAINNRTIENLVNDELHFSSPKFFNDQYEFKPSIDKIRLKSEIKKILSRYDEKQNAIIFKNIKNMFFYSALSKVGELVREYYQMGYIPNKEYQDIAEILVDYLNNCDITFSINTINKYIFESVSRILSVLDSINETNPEFYFMIEDKIANEIYKHVRKSRFDFYLSYIIELFYSMTIDIFHVACFSLDYDNAPMWGHYADNLSGIVIGYCTNDLEKCGVKTSLGSVKWNEFKSIKKGILKRITYLESSDIDHNSYLSDIFYHVVHFDILKYAKKNDSTAKFNVDYFYQKPLIWRYENEYRIVKKGKESLKVKPNAIYIGSRVNDKNKAEIIKLAESKKISCFIMENDSPISNSHFIFRKIL